jgi:hypothetical protein
MTGEREGDQAMGKDNRKFYGYSQYRAPLNYELAGKFFHLIMDDGHDYKLRFLDGETLEWTVNDASRATDGYTCLKGDDTTYFVHVQPQALGGKVNHAWIIDLAQNLATLVVTEEGAIPASARLVRVTPVFGAIKQAGRPLDDRRHSFTDRMVGRHIIWHYSPSFSIQHIYHAPHLYRLPLFDMATFSKRFEDKAGNVTDPEDIARIAKRQAYYERTKELYPFCEEPCFHIRISENMNLFCFCEENETLLDPEQAIGGGGLILLQDIERLTDVGLSYCLGEYYLVSACGEENFDGDPIDQVPSPYDQTRLQTMPCIYR